MDVSKRAKVLIQAMPYIKKYSGETIVVKYGGNAMINEELKAAVMSDLVLMQLVGVNVVLVHGGGPEINAMLKAVGKESKFINGMRVTDKETIDIVQMVLAGKVNKSLVQLLGSHGGKAIGLCGLDGRMLMAEKLVTGADLGYVGEIKEVNPEPLNNVQAVIFRLFQQLQAVMTAMYIILTQTLRHRRLPLKSAQKSSFL
mgnify:CR=1 FL=1